MMRVFVAGGTGVIGRRLVSQLVARGHQVTATTTSAGKLGLLELGRRAPRLEADRRERVELAARFFDALRDGDVDGLKELLAADVQMVRDGGGQAPAFARSVIGADNVARVLASIFPVLAQIDARVEPRGVNGQPGAILRDRDGKVLSTLTLDVLGGRIQTIRSVVNPDKLGHVGPVADAWAVAREVKHARRPRD